MELEIFDGYQRILERIAGIVSGCNYDPRRDMHFIDPKAVPHSDWFMPDGFRFYVPKHLGTICPECHQHLFIDVEVVGNELIEISSVGMRGRCPRSVCGFSDIKVFLVGARTRNQTPQCSEIWMLPDPGVRTLLVSSASLPRGFSDRMFVAYKNSIDTYNSGMWSPSVSSSGRVIEAIGKSFFPSTDGSETIRELFTKLRTSLNSNSNPDYKTLLMPILNLDKTLALSRNSGSHFDLSKEPDKDVANKLIDLVEFLLRYIYLIPGEAKDLDEAVRLLGPGDSEL